MDKTNLKDALVRILAHVSKQGSTDRIADAIEVVEQYLVEIKQDLAEERREQQRKDRLVAATIDYWEQHVRDERGWPIPLYDEVKAMIEDLAGNDYDEPEMLVGDVGVTFCSVMDEDDPSDEPELRTALIALQQRDPEGFKALEEFCLQYHW
jgi:hypothetical protein